MVTRAATYSRKSTTSEKGVSGDSLSIERQRELARAFAGARGWDLVADFADDALSGADFLNLEGLARMLARPRSLRRRKIPTCSPSHLRRFTAASRAATTDEMKARVTVTLKSGVLDPQGKAIEGALKALGIAGVASVRQGKVFDIELQDEDAGRAEDALKEAAEKLLANPIIENYRIEVGG